MNNNSVKDTMYFITDGKGTSMTIDNNVSQITNDNCQDITNKKSRELHLILYQKNENIINN